MAGKRSMHQRRAKPNPSEVVVPKLRSIPAPKRPEDLAPLGEAAFQGIAGEIVQLIAPESEAEPAPILAQFLAGFGNVLGRGPGFEAQQVEHGCNLFVGIVGDTASSRKGTSLAQALFPLKEAFPAWEKRIMSGASSGEGLISEVQDDRDSDEDNTDRTTLRKRDKRLLLVETEFASVLERMNSQGNTLSPLLRQAWDGSRLDTLVKRNRVTATGAHISVIAHITAEEQQRKLNSNEQMNGFANRFIWVLARRARYLPRGGNASKIDWGPYIARLRQAVKECTKEPLDMSESAWALWDKIYKELSTSQPGIIGAVTARGPAHVRRLATIYAVLDLSPTVRIEHLRAALEIWRYSVDTAQLLFGGGTGDSTADRILEFLGESPLGLTRKQINDAFDRHKSAKELGRALGDLTRMGLVESVTKKTGGRPATTYRIISPSDD